MPQIGNVDPNREIARNRSFDLSDAAIMENVKDVCARIHNVVAPILLGDLMVSCSYVRRILYLAILPLALRTVIVLLSR